MFPYVAVCYRMLQTKASVPAVTKVPFQLGNWVAGWKGVHMELFRYSSSNKQTYVCVTTLLMHICYIVYINLESKEITMSTIANISLTWDKQKVTIVDIHISSTERYFI